jgi:hypothetical protein
VAQRRAVERIRRREDVAPRGVLKTDVNVQAAARHVAVGLGEKGSLAAHAARHALDDTLESQRLVANTQPIGCVREVHFVLSRTVFGERGGGRHILQSTDAIDLGEQRGVLVEIRHRVDLGAEFTAARQWAFRRLRLALRIALDIHEVELVFDGHHRRERQVRESRQHIRKQMTRVAEKRRAILFVHRELNLCDVGLPGHGDQRLGNRHARPICIAVRKPQSRGLDRPAFDVEREHRAGEGHTTFENPRDIAAVDSLAALHRVQIVHERIEEPHLGVLDEETL